MNRSQSIHLNSKDFFKIYAVMNLLNMSDVVIALRCIFKHSYRSKTTTFDAFYGFPPFQKNVKINFYHFLSFIRADLQYSCIGLHF